MGTSLLGSSIRAGTSPPEGNPGLAVAVPVTRVTDGDGDDGDGGGRAPGAGRVKAGRSHSFHSRHGEFLS